MAGGYRCLAAGDGAVTVEFGTGVSEALAERVRRLDAALAADRPEGVVETIPTYRSLQVVFDPCVTGFAAVEAAVARAVAAADAGAGVAAGAVRVWTVPVAYGGEHGVDLEAAAGRLGLDADALAEAHAACKLTVAMIGFQPGFTYLAGLPVRLHLSRLETPRRVTPPGSVSIGGVQAAISSVAAPSAWNLLGRTPVRPFDLGREEPFLFRPGDRVRFRRVDAGEFARIEARVAAGEVGAGCVEEPAGGG